MGKETRPNRSYVLALVAALIVPGLGRAIAGNIAPGIVLFLLFVLLWQIGVDPWWLNAIIKFAIWSFFASIDVGYVTKRARQD